MFHEMNKPELLLNFLSPVNPFTNLEKTSAHSKKQRKVVYFLLKPLKSGCNQKNPTS